jgi:NADH-quinone oxidoreductase subunit F
MNTMDTPLSGGDSCPDGLAGFAGSLPDASPDSYLQAGGFKALRAFAAFPPGERAALLRRAGLRDFGPRAWPAHALWNFQRRQTGGIVADARDAFPGDPLPGRLIASNPFGLLEGLAMASVGLGREQAEVVLSPGRDDLARILLDALAMARPELAQAKAALVLSFRFEENRPELPALAVDPLVLALDARAWCALPLSHAGGCAGQSFTVGHAGGMSDIGPGQDARTALGLDGLLLLDDGLSGFAAEGEPLPADPERIMAMGLNPGYRHIRALRPGECPVDAARQALYRHWRLAAVREDHPHRGLLARAGRLAAELALGRGSREHLEELAHCARLLEEAGLKAAWTLGSALSAFGALWLEHAGGLCASGACRARRVAPCQARCPSGIDIPNFLPLTGRGEHARAAAVMTRDNPLPLSCGLICPAPCEKVCLRGKVDSPIHIRAMKAVSARAVVDGPEGYPAASALPPSSGKRVAVVGGGPAGLSCASFLARLGHEAAIFEAMPELGGMMRYGIPEYRLPKALLDKEIGTVLKLGVAVSTGKALGRDFTLDDLARQGFDAVFLGLGAWTSRALGLEGETLMAGVISGTQFLVELGLGRKPAIGRKVVVVGGGNTAMDCARTALRLGAGEVNVVYRRSRAEMPAAPEEVEDAMHEGARFTFLAAPVRLVGEGGRLAGMEVVTMALGAPDASGRRRPEPLPGSERVIACDTIISAIGQFCDESFTEGADGTLGEVCLTKWKTIKIDQATLATDRPGVFAGGDAAMGPATVVEAVRDGKRAAHAIGAFLAGRDFDPAAADPKPGQDRELLCSPKGCGWAEHERPVIPVLPVAARHLNFEQVELGLTQEMAHTEARRCLRCDVCIGCGLCQLVCSEAGGDALRFKEVEGRLVFDDFDRPTDRCVGCGACARVCPTGAMSIVLEKGAAAISFTGHAVSELAVPACAECGKPLPADQFLEHLRRRMGEHLASSARMDQEVCPDCARRAKGVSFVRAMLK